MITRANLFGTYRRWSPNEIARLEEVRAGLITRRQLAEQLSRSFKAIKRKLCP